MRGPRIVVALLAVACLHPVPASAGPERPCNQQSPDGEPSYTELSGNRFYMGDNVGVYGNSGWYLYADRDANGAPRIQGRGTVDNLGAYIGADRRCFYGYGYGIGAAAAPPARVTTKPATRCNDRSWTGGTVDVCDGTLVYRDYVYDDYGADTGENASSTHVLSAPTGDVRYPAADVNSADLLALRLGIEGGRLRVRFELNSLFHSGSTVGAIAIDTDNNPKTGGGEWRGASTPVVRSGGWDVLHTFRRGDPKTNVIEGTMPRPRGRRWRVQALTARAGGPVMNVAFRGTSESGRWWEDNQAAALSSADVSAFGHAVEVADLRRGVTRTQKLGPGLYERVYTSRYAVPPGEGVSYDGIPGRNLSTNYFAQEFHYLGRHQPYSVYVPRGRSPHGLQLVLHGFGVNHTGQVTQRGFQEDLGEARNRLLVGPLGRGPAGFYSDYSERDVLDVLDDVSSLYGVDRRRVFVSGYSMGGYGTYRMAMLYPDRFAGFIDWVGGTGDTYAGTPLAGNEGPGVVGKVIDLVGNVRHVPGAMLYGGADELVWVTGALAMADAFAAAANPYVFYLHPAGEHFTFSLADDWVKESEYTKGLWLVRKPARVTFRTRADLGNARLGLAHDQAYWVSAIRSREKRAYADIDLTTNGCGGKVAATAPTSGAGLSPVPWISQGSAVTARRPVRQAATMAGSLSNVSFLKIDAGDACLGPRATYRIRTNGPAVLALSDGRRATLRSAGTFHGRFS